jgi:hypothetical protein
LNISKRGSAKSHDKEGAKKGFHESKKSDAAYLLQAKTPSRKPAAAGTRREAVDEVAMPVNCTVETTMPPSFALRSAVGFVIPRGFAVLAWLPVKIS